MVHTTDWELTREFFQLAGAFAAFVLASWEITRRVTSAPRPQIMDVQTKEFRIGPDDSWTPPKKSFFLHLKILVKNTGGRDARDVYVGPGMNSEERQGSYSYTDDKFLRTLAPGTQAWYEFRFRAPLKGDENKSLVALRIWSVAHAGPADGIRTTVSIDDEEPRELVVYQVKRSRFHAFIMRRRVRAGMRRGHWPGPNDGLFHAIRSRHMLLKLAKTK